MLSMTLSQFAAAVFLPANLITIHRRYGQLLITYCMSSTGMMASTIKIIIHILR